MNVRTDEFRSPGERRGLAAFRGRVRRGARREATRSGVRAAAVLGAVVLMAGNGSPASAYWTGSGSGTGSATTATLDPPTDVQATADSGLKSVAISWTASGGDLQPQGYYVVRSSSSPSLAGPACDSSPADLIEDADSCTDTFVDPGEYTYTVTAVYNSWSAAGAGAEVTVEPDGADPTVTVAEVNGDTRSFPWHTKGPVTSFGGTCGTDPGDADSVTPLVDDAALGPVACADGSWAVTLAPSLADEATLILLAVQTDLTGNEGIAPESAVVIDTTAPTVSVTRVNGNVAAFPLSTNATVESIGGTCGSVSGDSSQATVFIEGAAPLTASCTGVGEWTLTLNSTPLSSDGIHSISATQSDAAGNLGTAPPQTVFIDRTAPTVAAITRTGSAAAVRVGPLTWQVTFSEPVTGVAASNFQLVTDGIGGATPLVGPPTASASSDTWTVSVSMEGVTGTDAGEVRLALTSLLGITDAFGNTLSAGLVGEAYTYDTTPAVVTGVSAAVVDGTYRADASIPVTVTFSEPVLVTGSPQLALAVGTAASAQAVYTSGSGTATLTFTYTVSAGQSSPDLDYTGSGALTLNGGVIADAVGNAATLTLAAPGAPGSLSASKALVIDAAVPVVTVTGITGHPNQVQRIRAAGTAGPGLGSVTVVFCKGAPCGSVSPAPSSTITLTGIAVSTTGAWQSGWTSSATAGTWYAVASQGGVTSAVFGPYQRS